MNSNFVLKTCFLYFNKFSSIIVISMFKLDTFLKNQSLRKAEDCGCGHFWTKYTKPLDFSKFQLWSSSFELFALMTESILSQSLCFPLLPFLPIVFVTLSVLPLLNLKLNNEVTRQTSFSQDFWKLRLSYVQTVSQIQFSQWHLTFWMKLKIACLEFYIKS